MVQISWDDLGDAAYGAGTAIGSMIQGAGAFYCDMIRRYPAWSLQNPLGLDPISRGINDKLCGSSPPLPPPDNPAVPGGKCQCVLYKVYYTGRFANGISFSGDVTVRGAISRASYYTLPNGALAFGFRHFNGDCTAQETFNVISNFTAEDVTDRGLFGRIDLIERVDGQPDTCGDQPPTYKPTLPTVPDVNRVIPIIIAPNVNIFTPITLIRPNINLNFNPNFNFNLQPIFNFPDIGINLGFNIGGVNINNSINIGSGNTITIPDPRPQPPTLPPSGGTDIDLTELYDRLTVIKDQLDDIEECACEENPPLQSIVIGQGRSGDAGLPAKTKFVITTITAFPSDRKFQSGLNAPEVLYSGWAWFKHTSDGLAERDPVDSTRKIYFCENGALRFCWTLYSGFTLTATAYYEA